jgi:hypothetical protein
MPIPPIKIQLASDNKTDRLSRSDFAWSRSDNPDQNGDRAIPLELLVIG